MAEQSTTELEKKVWELKDKIIEVLERSGGNPSARVKQMGYEAIQIASNEDRGGCTALILHVDGTWSIKFAMSGYPLEDTSPDTLLREYARVVDLDIEANRQRILAGLIEALDKTLKELRSSNFCAKKPRH